VTIEAREPPGGDEVPYRLLAPGRIVLRQTTYWEVQSDSGTHWRIHFRGKLEMRFRCPDFASVELFHSHPILVNHVEPWCDVYFKGHPADPGDLEDALAKTTHRVTEGWRDVAEYRNAAAPFSGGYGLAVRAPTSLGRAAEADMIRALLSTSSICSGTQSKRCVVLVFDKSYVVAERFRFEELEKAV
jgi:hypothetical protein